MIYQDQTKNAKIFDFDFSGIISFDELNDKLHIRDKDKSEQFNWGSYGDDALYKFLSANCDPWNNGEKTRQIKINGVRNRYYLLNDIAALYLVKVIKILSQSK